MARHQYILGTALLFSLSAAAQDLPITLVIDGGVNSPGTYYEITSSEGIEKVDGEVDGHIVTLNDDDIITGNTVRGYVRMGKDGYRVFGELVSVQFENSDAATIYLNGELYTPSASSPSSDDDGATPSGETPPVYDFRRRPIARLPSLASPNNDKDDPGAVMHPDPFEPGDKAIIDCLVAKRRNPDAATPCDRAEDDEEESTRAIDEIRPYRPSLVSPPDDRQSIGETEKNIPAVSAPRFVTGIGPKPLGGYALGGGESADDKGDKGSEVTETTPLVGFSTGASTLSGISGRAGENTHAFDFDTRALSHIGWREKRDKLCQLNLISHRVYEKSWLRILQHCAPDDTFACESEVCRTDGMYIKEAHNVKITGQRPVITALRVCVNGKANGRVKGMSVRGGEILNNATVSGSIETDQDTLPNCKSWKPYVLCPAGMAATGVRAHFDAGSGLSRNVSQLVGLQLVCRKIIKK